jgi:single-stranded DNA-binding protein
MGYIKGKPTLSNARNTKVLRFYLNTPRVVVTGDTKKTVDDINTVCVWGWKGIQLAKLLAHGSHIYVFGKLRSSTYYDSRVKADITSVYVQADHVVLIGKKPKKK